MWPQGPERASGRLLEVVPQLRTCAVLQHLDHQGEQLLPQTNIVVHHLEETTVKFISNHVIQLYLPQNMLVKGGVSRILLKNKNKDVYKSNAAQSSLLGLYKCLVVTVYGDTRPSACILMFWLFLDISGEGGVVVAPANDSTQVRLRAPQLDTIQTRESADIVLRKGNTAL